jgi:hypothetical protein
MGNERGSPAIFPVRIFCIKKKVEAESKNLEFGIKITV